ncbi:DUF1641 domain-containing protein [Stygiolobus caldivivus]|uniref:DUF1641 domain-containing protein n=1 Tax=Stygiolobus caldivivus TaxID=2824673 RepID=A0A8D5ZJ82_9CREN|nr:DUF1641 domain-containing protein [Stygiolobus caldivivus]BCU70336.1 hypothetical protein KN1_16330 [Stygiolobus caldivivus]
MQDVNFEKVMSKIDEKKVDEIAELIDHLPTLNETLKVVSQLKESGALDTLVNLSYSAKMLRDMLNDDALSNVATMLSGLLELSETVGENYNKFQELMENVDVLADLTRRLKELKESGALDVGLNSLYTLKTLKDMLNDEALANLGNTMSALLEFSNVFSENYKGIMNTLKNWDVIDKLMVKLKELDHSGALDVGLNSLYALKTFKDMLNDEALGNIAATLSLTLDFLPKGLEFLEHAMDPVFYNMVTSLTSPEAKKMLSNPPKITLGGLIASMRDEDVQRGLGIFITMLKILGKSYKA